VRAVYVLIVLGFSRRLLGRVLVPSGGSRVRERPQDPLYECAMYLYEGKVSYRVGGTFLVGGRASVEVNYRVSDRYGSIARCFGYEIGFYSVGKGDLSVGSLPGVTSPRMMEFLNSAYDYVKSIVPEGSRHTGLL